MGTRGPSSSVSMASYLQGGGSGSSGDPYRARSRSSSAGASASASASGPSSWEHSVEGRGGGDNRREPRPSGDFRSSHPNQALEQNRRPSGQNWGYGRDRGKNKDFYWRDDSKGVHGRVQGVFYDDDGPVGTAEAADGYTVSVGSQESQSRRPPSAQRRPENSYGGDNRRKSLSNGFERQKEKGHSANQRQVNEGQGGFRGPSQSGGYRGRAPPHEGKSPGSVSRLLPGRFSVDSKEAVFGGEGRDLGKFGSPNSMSLSKEVVFGGGKELETFGSPRLGGFSSRNSPSSAFLPPPRVKGGLDNGRDGGGMTLRGLGEGDLRRSFSEEGLGGGDGWRSNSSSSSNGSKSSRRDTTQAALRRDHSKGDDELGAAHERGSSFHRSGSSVGRASDLSPDSSLLSPSSSTTKKTFTRKNSYDRRKNRDASDQLPVFSPSSESKSSIHRATSSIDRLSRESSTKMSLDSPSKMSLDSPSKLSIEGFTSESTSRDLGLDSEGLNAPKQLPRASSESASAGMHRTRSTDWYEICLKEEEEEEMRALARKLEEDTKRDGTQTPVPAALRNFGRSGSSNQKGGESAVFSPSSGSGAHHREPKSLEKGHLQEKIVRGDAADSAQLNFSPSQRTSDAGIKQGLFTPWNALQAVPTSRNEAVPPAPRPKPEPPRDSFENLRISIAGGRQEARGRRSVSVESDEAENWRGERRPSRDYARDAVVRGDVVDEGENWMGERQLSKEHSRDVVLRSDLQNGGENVRGERRLSRDYSRDGVVRTDHQPPRESVDGPSGRATASKLSNGREEAHSGSVGEAEQRGAEVLLNRVNKSSSVRPATVYRALQEVTAGDQEALPHVSGSCPDMCPSKERSQRERLRDLAVFERVSGDMRKTSKDLAVKKFCRTVVASELESTDVRPLPVLWRTQQYLLGLLDDPEFSFNIVHNFLFDRTRAIRQELGMQRILDRQSITIHEEIVRFHILSEHELRDLNRKRSKLIDTHLNLQQLSKSLYSLLNLYISLGGKEGAHFENEAEFHAYYVLLNLGNHGRFQAESLALWFPNVPSHVLEAPEMQFARKALRCFRSDNFIGFFRLVRKATYMQASLLELNFDAVRAMALATLNVAEYKLHPYPLSDLAEQLILEENEVDELCMYYGLLTGVDGASQRPSLLAKQGQFAFPEKENLPRYGCRLIDGKRALSFYEEVKKEHRVRVK